MGPLLIKQLLQNRHTVTVFNRGKTQTDYGKDIKFIRGDRDKGFNIKQHFNIVIDTCAYTGTQTKAALKNLSFDFFIHFSTAAVYKKTGVFPLIEESPLGAWPVWGDYNEGKVECEQVLNQSGKKFAVIRPVYILGPRNYMDRENFIYSRLYSSKTLIIPGNGKAICQFAFVDDVAKVLLFLAEKKLEGAFNCASNEMVTLKGLVEYLATLVGKTAKIEYNHSADEENFNEEEFPFANENFICSNKKLEQLGITFKPLLKGLKDDFNLYYKDLLKKPNTVT